MSDLSDSLMVNHFWWATRAICSHRSVLVSDLSDSLASLTKNEGMSKSLIFKNKKTYIKHTKNNILDFFCQILLNELLICSSIMSDLSELLTVAHLSWWPERFVHGRLFILSNLSDLLTVAHLSWAIWGNRSQSLIWFEQNERISKFPALCASHEVLLRHGVMQLRNLVIFVQWTCSHVSV